MYFVFEIFTSVEMHFCNGVKEIIINEKNMEIVICYSYLYLYNVLKLFELY